MCHMGWGLRQGQMQILAPKSDPDSNCRAGNKVKDGGPGERKPGRSRMQSKAGGGGEIGDVSYSCAGSLKYTWVQGHNGRSQG